MLGTVERLAFLSSYGKKEMLIPRKVRSAPDSDLAAGRCGTGALVEGKQLLKVNCCSGNVYKYRTFLSPQPLSNMTGFVTSGAEASS